jgi:hypothetical protein
VGAPLRIERSLLPSSIRWRCPIERREPVPEASGHGVVDALLC